MGRWRLFIVCLLFGSLSCKLNDTHPTTQYPLITPKNENATKHTANTHEEKSNPDLNLITTKVNSTTINKTLGKNFTDSLHSQNNSSKYVPQNTTLAPTDQTVLQNTTSPTTTPSPKPVSLNTTVSTDSDLPNTTQATGSVPQNTTASILPTTTSVLQTTQLICLEQANGQEVNESCYEPNDSLTCFHDPLFCKKFFGSGSRSLQKERPINGEYSSLKHKQWFFTIQHGGIAFLYHPCTKESRLNELRSLASGCLHRYVMAPSQLIAEDMPIAMVSWGCYRLSRTIDRPTMQRWIRAHAYKGPASHVTGSGGYKENLLNPSNVLTDRKDTFLCPSDEQIDMFQPTSKKPFTLNSDPERIINNRFETLNNKRKHDNVNISVTVKTKIETGSAIWAAGSLLFLCTILFGFLYYTKMWDKSRAKNTYNYNVLYNDPREFEYDPSHGEFSLLKSSRKLVNIFRNKTASVTSSSSNRGLDSMSHVNLMVPINEESDEDDFT